MLLVIVSLFGILLSSLSLLSGKKMYLLLIRITSLESLYASLAFLMTFLPAFDVLLLSCMVSSFSHVSVLQSYSSSSEDKLRCSIVTTKYRSKPIIDWTLLQAVSDLLKVIDTVLVTLRPYSLLCIFKA